MQFRDLHRQFEAMRAEMDEALLGLHLEFESICFTIDRVFNHFPVVHDST